jgi:arsenate reductase
MPALARRLTAEALGTGVLVAAVVGSGIMASRLSGDVGLQLVINALATVAALGVLIACLAPLSGAHLNPAVTLVMAARRETTPADAAGYVAAQVAGGLLGVALANVMFGLPAWTASTRHRDGAGLLLGEVVATAGLVAVIGALARTGRLWLVALLVPAWIGAAYFFTSSTSFANPAVTIARTMTDTFTGIAPSRAPAFIAAELVGAAVGAAAVLLLWPRSAPSPADPAASVPVRIDEEELR